MIIIGLAEWRINKLGLRDVDVKLKEAAATINAEVFVQFDDYGDDKEEEPIYGMLSIEVFRGTYMGRTYIGLADAKDKTTEELANIFEDVLDEDPEW